MCIKLIISAMKRIVLIIGTRPNFMKAAPVYKALVKLGCDKVVVDLVHTGQHYDVNMSDVFLDQLDIKESVTWLDIDLKGKSQNTQSALIMLALEGYFNNFNGTVDLVVVFGDVTSTVAAALVANKMGIKLAHVEAGNRSFDRDMPEEINRVLVDHMSDYLFVAEPYGVKHLEMENIGGDVFYVGNSMIDTLLNLKDKASKLTTYKDIGLESGRYILFTLHRPHNVDCTDSLKIIVDILDKLSNHHQIVFPVHPRQRSSLDALLSNKENIKLIDPQGYLEFLNLNLNCAVLVTDSGGLQEETTVLKIPCLTLRPNTERPITCVQGTNFLMKTLNSDIICYKINKLVVDRLSGKWDSCCKSMRPIDLWDGKAGERIADTIINKLLS